MSSGSHSGMYLVLLYLTRSFLPMKWAWGNHTYNPRKLQRVREKDHRSEARLLKQTPSQNKSEDVEDAGDVHFRDGLLPSVCEEPLCRGVTVVGIGSTYHAHQLLFWILSDNRSFWDSTLTVKSLATKFRCQTHNTHHANSFLFWSNRQIVLTFVKIKWFLDCTLQV